MSDTRIDFLYLNEKDMIDAGVLDAGHCVETMEEVLCLLAKGDVLMGGKNRREHGIQLIFPKESEIPGFPLEDSRDRRFMSMPAYLGGRFHLAGEKFYGSNGRNVRKGLPRSILMMMLNDKDTGAPLALMSANLLSAYRTGAIPGVGAKYLARKDSTTVAIVGPGVMGKTALAAFMSVCPKIDTVKIKGRGKNSIDSFVEYVKKEFPQVTTIKVCETMEEAIRDSDIINTATSVGDKESLFPYIDEKWIKEGALICMPSAARFDEEFYLDENTKLVVDNYKLYEAWADEYPYPSYDPVQVVGAKFMDLLHDKKITREEIIDIADVITKKVSGRDNDKQRIIYSVGGMPVEDIAWGETVYKNALKLGIGVKLHLWDEPELH